MDREGQEAFREKLTAIWEKKRWQNGGKMVSDEPSAQHSWSRKEEIIDTLTKQASRSDSDIVLRAYPSYKSSVVFLQCCIANHSLHEYP